MSSEMRDGKAPRSLTLTFAETHPWEMLVRDRLVSLPRGHLKRFLLHLIETSGVDLDTDEVFRAQVESLLVSRHKALTQPVDELRRPAPVQVNSLSTPAASRKPGVSHWDLPPKTESVRADLTEEEAEKPVRRQAGLGSDSGFGALEI